MCPDTSCLFVGDGDLRQALQSQHDKSNIIFTGLRKDLPELYACMDVFVLPSLTEGLPMVLLEAMGSKLPVIATRVGFIPNVVKDGETGYLVSPGNEEELKERLLQLLNDSEKRKLMGENGFLRVKADFSSSRMADEYMVIYRKAILEGII